MDSLFWSATEYESDILLDEAKDIQNGHHLLVYNDDHNTFQWVIKCFIEICHHSYEQSEQLSLIIHTKGKAIVKNGKFDVLKPMKDALVDRGLSAVIEKVEA